MKLIFLLCIYVCADDRYNAKCTVLTSSLKSLGGKSLGVKSSTCRVEFIINSYKYDKLMECENVTQSGKCFVTFDGRSMKCVKRNTLTANEIFLCFIFTCIILYFLRG
jgi:hypothetical protein